MSKANFQNRMQGHRVQAPSNRDLEQKLTYQQLLNFNHDLSKQNQQLKNIATRLGQQLRSLHTQFDIRPRDENNELYNAINSQPILHHYQLTLIPLFEAYEAKIQEFQSGFETINEEFINLQKKYIQVSGQNQKLRADLTDRTKQLIQVYNSGSSDKLGADFGQIILAQINEKQRFLAEENSRLQREYQRYRSEAEKSTRELADSKRKEQEVSSRFKQLELGSRQLETELRSLKGRVFEEETRINDLESEKKKIENDLQRAMSQVSQLNKDRGDTQRLYDELKGKYDRYVAQSQQYEQQRGYPGRSPLQQTRNQQSVGDDGIKKLNKLQKDYDVLNRERNKLNQKLQQSNVALEQANERIAEMKKRLQVVEGEKRAAEMGDAKNRKLVEQLAEKGRADAERMKREHEEELQRAEEEYYGKLEGKQKKVVEVEEALDRIKLERDKLEQENIIHTALAKEAGKQGRNKDSERLAEKLREKLTINDELFREQLQIVQNDNVYLKREAQGFKADSKEKAQEIRRLKQQLQKVKVLYSQAEQQHSLTIQQIKRVKNEYEGNLRDKERLFDQKIREIKLVVEQSDKRRKSQREKVAEASREYKRVLEQIRNTYEERIRVLESENGYNSKVRKAEGY